MKSETVQKLLELNKKIMIVQQSKIKTLMDFVEKVTIYAKTQNDITLGIVINRLVKKLEEEEKENESIIKEVADLRVQMEKENNDNVQTTI